MMLSPTAGGGLSASGSLLLVGVLVLVIAGLTIGTAVFGRGYRSSSRMEAATIGAALLLLGTVITSYALSLLGA